VEKMVKVNISKSILNAFQKYHKELNKAFFNDMSVSYKNLGSALGNPTHAVKNVTNELAKIFKCDSVWITSLGSTTSNYVVLTYIRRKYHNKPILIMANPHISTINAAIDLNIPIRFVPIDFNERFEAIIPSSAERILNYLKKYNVACIIVTSPTYEGIEANIKKIVALIREFNDKIPIIIDNAWGWGLKTPIIEGADIVVRSSHKMDGALQGASVILAKKERIDLELFSECVNARFSTSQSYPILGSIEYIYKGIWAKYESKLTKYFLEWSNGLKEDLKKAGIEVLENESLKEYFKKGQIVSLDPRKITIKVKGNGFKIYEKLQERYGIIPEKSGIKTLTFIVTTKVLLQDTREVSEKIIKCLNNEKDFKNNLNIPLPLNNWDRLRKLESYEAVASKTKIVPLEKAIGKISAETIAVYPPGIPLIIPGQIIQKDVIDYLKSIFSIGGEIISRDPNIKTIRVVI
jgi:arginine decarboxylase